MSDDSDKFFLRLHTESLLVSLPTPDFSMPYNVICLACTVVAIAFGSLHNLTTRSFVVVDPDKKKSNPLKRLLNFVRRKKGDTESKDTKKEEPETAVKDDKAETDDSIEEDIDNEQKQEVKSEEVKSTSPRRRHKKVKKES